MKRLCITMTQDELLKGLALDSETDIISITYNPDRDEYSMYITHPDIPEVSEGWDCFKYPLESLRLNKEYAYLFSVEDYLDLGVD
jgi:hypothetical protein